MKPASFYNDLVAYVSKAAGVGSCPCSACRHFTFSQKAVQNGANLFARVSTADAIAGIWAANKNNGPL